MLIKNVKTPYFVVLWDDMQLEVRLNEQLVRWLLSRKPVCTVPCCYDKVTSLMPTVLQPELSAKKLLSVKPSFPKDTEAATLFPYDYMGIYHTQKFLSSTGFDLDMDDGFWQLADFGLSCWERGFKITLHSGMACRYLQSHALQYDELNRGWKKFDAKHFGCEVNKNGKIHYSARSRRTLKDWLGQYSLDHSRQYAQIMYEADKLITFWEVSCGIQR
ncbi:MAG: hypothetical protein PF495_12400 [Spirochaetales bacterium]|nr:hypothetical protein [Spirochaetales bacterium]